MAAENHEQHVTKELKRVEFAALVRLGTSSVFTIRHWTPQTEGDSHLRIHPRRFSFKNGDFRTDTDNVPEDKTYAEFDLPRLKV